MGVVSHTDRVGFSPIGVVAEFLMEIMTEAQLA